MDEAEQERQKRIDERFERTKQDIDKLESRQCAEEDRCRKLEELNIKMGEILKNHEEKLQNHDKRIGALENVAGARWNAIINYLLAGIVGALVAAVMRMVLGG